jgi:hypothetical protein
MKIVEKVFSDYRLVEGNPSKLPDRVLCRLEYPVCNIGTLNHNKRMYETKLCERVLQDKDISEKVGNRCLFGHAEHPEKSNSCLEKTSHVITRQWIDESTNRWMQEFDVLDTPYGRLVDTLVRAKCRVGVSTRAEGDLEESRDNEGKVFYRVVPDTYRYITTDFTADPSTFNSYPENIQLAVVEQVKRELNESKVDPEFVREMLSQSPLQQAKELIESIQSKEKSIPKTTERPVNENYSDMVEFFKKKFSELDETGKKKVISSLQVNESTTRAVAELAVSTKIAEASVRAERDKAIELLESLKNEAESGKVETAIVVGQLKEGKARSFNTHRSMYRRLSERTRHLADENFSLRKEVKSVSEAKDEKVISLTEQVLNLSTKLSEAENTSEELKNKTKELTEQIKSLTESYENEKKEIKEAALRDSVAHYAAVRIKTRGVSLSESAQTLLAECSSYEEVDRLLVRSVDALRESALRSKQVDKIEVSSAVSPESKGVQKSVSTALRGMLG